MIEILHNKQNTEKTEFIAYDNGEVLGRCAGSLCDGIFVFDELDCDDFFVDGLVRAILNLMDLKGVMTARFELPESDIERLKKLRFISDDSYVIPDIAEFFSGKCGGSN